jgi:hypothetical protein
MPGVWGPERGLDVGYVGGEMYRDEETREAADEQRERRQSYQGAIHYS